MVLRYLFVFLFLISVHSSRAQQSLMQSVSYPFLDTLIAVAKANYPTVRSYQNRVRIAELNVTRTKLDWFNIVSFTYLYNPNSSTTLINPNSQANQSFLLNGYQVGLSTSIGSILEKPGAVKTAREQLEIAKNEQDQYNLTLEALVKQRYFIYIQQSEILKSRAKSFSNAESALQESKYKFEKGEETFEAYNRVLSYHSGVVQLRTEAEGAFLVAKSSLEEIIGTKLDSVKNGVR
jgi:outer membrane protein TolC